MNFKPLEGANAPIRMFLDDRLLAQVEEDVFRQARNTANTQGVENVCILPDCHSGYGAPIGSVVVSTDRVIPGPVGYDIGCFTGDTLVPTVEGVYSLAEMTEVGKDIYVFAVDDKQRVRVAKATAKMTRADAPLVKVTLDNGREITCTPDHEFMLRDGSYRKASELSAHTSLMPFYSSLSKGYPIAMHPATGRSQTVHWIMARQGLLGDVPKFEGQKTIIHHRDFNPANNHPSNLQFMGDKDHMSFHHEHGKHGWHLKTPEFESRRVAALAAKAQTPEGHAYYAERGTKNILAYMENHQDHFRAAVAGNGERGKQYLQSYNQSDAGRAKSNEIANRLYPCETCGEQIKSGIGLHNHRRYKHGYNHKVVSVEVLAHCADVYCLTVPEYHNFALDAGVFVHNCGMALYLTDVPSTLLKDHTLRRGVINAIDRGIAMGEGKSALHGVHLTDELVEDVLNRGAHALADRRIVPTEWLERCERPVHPMPVKDGQSKPFKLSEVPPRAARGYKQLGTLGGGNHFIELQELKLPADPTLRAIAQQWGMFDGQLAIMVHSGSRGFGHGLGEWAFAEFKTYNDAEGETYNDKELVHAPVKSKLGQQYMRYVAAGANFALCNRLLMAKVVKQSVEDVLTHAKVSLLYEISHNLAQWEPDENGDLKLVHRKGTTRAFPAHHSFLKGGMWEKTGHPVITPGSMGTYSAIQVGLDGAAASFYSINHGAGRRLSRAAAKRTLSQGQVDADLAALDILVNARHVPLDEAPAAYKDMDHVLGAVEDCGLAAVVAKCYPIGSMKGHDEPRGHASASEKYKKGGKRR